MQAKNGNLSFLVSWLIKYIQKIKQYKCCMLAWLSPLVPLCVRRKDFLKQCFCAHATLNLCPNGISSKKSVEREGYVIKDFMGQSVCCFCMMF